MTLRELAVKSLAPILIGAGLFASLNAYAATLEVTLQPTTTDETGATLPATGPGALTSHRVEYGTCNGVEFGQALGQTVLPMPRLVVTFDVPKGLYCVRAFASNQFGEGKPYPVSIIGPAPSEGGAIIVLRQSQ